MLVRDSSCRVVRELTAHAKCLDSRPASSALQSDELKNELLILVFFARNKMSNTESEHFRTEFL